MCDEVVGVPELAKEVTGELHGADYRPNVPLRSHCENAGAVAIVTGRATDPPGHPFRNGIAVPPYHRQLRRTPNGPGLRRDAELRNRVSISVPTTARHTSMENKTKPKFAEPANRQADTQRWKRVDRHPFVERSARALAISLLCGVAAACSDSAIDD